MFCNYDLALKTINLNEVPCDGYWVVRSKVLMVVNIWAVVIWFVYCASKLLCLVGIEVHTLFVAVGN
jgi:hypothetical protein